MSITKGRVVPASVGTTVITGCSRRSTTKTKIVCARRWRWLIAVIVRRLIWDIFWRSRMSWGRGVVRLVVGRGGEEGLVNERDGGKSGVVDDGLLVHLG
jgi:hypothetical protein